MARNGSGTMSVVNTFVAGNTITAASHNTNNTDIAAEITNSLALDGQSVMTGQTKAANGSVSAPSFTFGSDLDSGFYRAAANAISLALGGADIVTFATATVEIAVGTLGLPSGGIIDFNDGDVTITHSANTLLFAGATTGYGFDAIISPISDDGAPLGNTSNKWSDLFLAPGAVINFDNGDVTVTHSANALAFAGASSGYTFDTAVTTAAQLSGATAAGAMLATQAEQEAASATNKLVVPARQHSHPGHPKCWAYVGGAGSPSLDASYNITSVSDTAQGRLTITIATDFSATTWAGVAICQIATGTERITNTVGPDAGSIILESQDTAGAFQDPVAWNFVGLGDHA